MTIYAVSYNSVTLDVSIIGSDKFAFMMPHGFVTRKIVKRQRIFQDGQGGVSRKSDFSHGLAIYCVIVCYFYFFCSPISQMCLEDQEGGVLKDINKPDYSWL